MALDMIQNERHLSIVPVNYGAGDGPSRADTTQQTLARLRLATLAAHMRIESNPRLAALLQPGLTEQHYQDVLLRYYAYFTRVEPGLFSTLGGVIPAEELDRRRKIPLLQSDLAGYGIAAQPAKPDLAGRLTSAQALGRLYVHEGASLGSRLIHAALRRDVAELRPCAFFAGYGSATADVWRHTKVILAAGITGETEICEASEAANAAFGEIDCIMR